MKTFIPGLMLLLLLGSAAGSAEIGSSAPLFVLNDTKGRKVSLADYMGKVVFLNFWATWCIPCKEELPELERLHRKYSREGLKVIGVSVGSPEKSVSGVLQRSALSYPVVLDNKGAAAEIYRCSHMPTSYIVDRDGVIRFIHKGYGRQFLPMYEKEIADLLKQR